MSVLGKTKKVNCLVLRGNIIDREILISGKMLKLWRMIHPTFPHESVETYIINKLRSNDSHVLDSNKIFAIYEKSKIMTKEKLSQKDQKCTDLRNQILKDHHDIFKEQLGPDDRVNIAPVHLEVDHTRNIKPVQAMKPFDIPFHLRKPATKEFNEMLKSGVLTENKEASEWCSQSFPVQKPHSDPISCRWVTDFRNLNRALKRPVWGRESSSQLLRRIDPQARYFRFQSNSH